MSKRITLRNLTRALTVGLTCGGLLTACEQPRQESTSDEAIGSAQSEIADVAHTAVERQSIGNCWLYAQATWVESLNLSALLAGAGNGGGGNTNSCSHNVCEAGDKLVADCSPCATKICDADPYCCDNEWDSVCTDAIAGVCGADACNDSAPAPVEEVKELDVSQSYWTYWHWFDQVTGYMYSDEISTGGNQWKSHAIVRDRGLMREVDFVPEDSNSEMSSRQSSALSTVNAALKNGELKSAEARRDGKLVRKVFDEAWGLSPEVRQQIDKVFGEDGEGTIRQGGSVDGTNIIDPATVPVRYTKFVDGATSVRETNLLEAVREWKEVRYPSSNTDRRKFLQRVQRALHDAQPVVITWDVEFNAMENGMNERRGSFNMQTLKDAGKPGSQGGHMTVLEDYAAETEAFGLLAAGVTLDPNNAEDKAKLDAALLTSTKIKFLRVKNSWGGNRPDRAFAKDFPGYHDLWMDYLDGPIKFCPNVDNPTNDNCNGESVPLDNVMLPPGY
jgi:hypothetical protein